MYSTNHLCRLPKEDITTEISENIPDHAREATLCAHYHNVSMFHLVAQEFLFSFKCPSVLVF